MQLWLLKLPNIRQKTQLLKEDATLMYTAAKVKSTFSYTRLTGNLVLEFDCAHVLDSDFHSER